MTVEILEQALKELLTLIDKADPITQDILTEEYNEMLAEYQALLVMDADEDTEE